MNHLNLCLLIFLSTCARILSHGRDEQDARQQQHFKFTPPHFKWEVWPSDHASTVSPVPPLASDLLNGLPVYISLTTIHNKARKEDSRFFAIAPTIESIFAGTLRPTRLFIFLSNESHLLDDGISQQDLSAHPLVHLMRRWPISVIFTDNIGPHRKLLPLLAHTWTQDCVIVTIDDHEIYPRSLLESLVKFHLVSGRRSVVAMRSRRLGLCSSLPWHTAPYTRNRRGLWPEMSPGKREMLSLPTGTGGVLYRPRYFHPVVFDSAMMNATITGDDLLFRLSTMARGVKVVTACVLEELGSTCSELADTAIERKLNWLFNDSSRSNHHPTDLTEYNLRLDRRVSKRLNRGLREGKGDFRKDSSLAANFNAGGGNNRMWGEALSYLREAAVLDMEAVLAKYAPVERRSCVLGIGGTDRGYWGGWIDSIWVRYQGVVDKECGIWTCDN